MGGSIRAIINTGYLAQATAQDQRIKSLVTVAAWLHDQETVKLIYGGEEGVNKKIELGKAARDKYEKTGEIEFVPVISTTDKDAAMFGQFDYYLNPKRGAIPEWENRFAVMSWPEWLKFSGIKAAGKIDSPVLMVHSKQAALPQGVQKFYQHLKGPKTLIWLDGSHFDFYDNSATVRRSAFLAVEHFRKTLP